MVLFPPDCYWKWGLLMSFRVTAAGQLSLMDLITKFSSSREGRKAESEEARQNVLGLNEKKRNM